MIDLTTLTTSRLWDTLQDKRYHNPIVYQVLSTADRYGMSRELAALTLAVLLVEENESQHERMLDMIKHQYNPIIMDKETYEKS